MVPGKSKAQCRDRWFYTVDPSINWGAFTEEEDTALMKLVDELGPGHWAEVARQLPGRIGVHVSVRWKQLSDESEVHAYLRADRKRRRAPTIPKVKDKSTLGAEDFEVRLIAPSIDADILL
jgi:myb proto-oncogene protein